MEPKKNNKEVNLENRKTTFLFAGLVLSCSIALTLLEWSTFEKENNALGNVEIDAIEQEVVPLSMKKTPTPKPKLTTQIEIVDDNNEIEKKLKAERVLKNMLKWIPVKQRGNPVKVKHSLPVTFKLAN